MKQKWFVDLVRITVEGGRGGDGMVHFHREKYRPRGGPDGGDGGDGGSVYLVADPGLKTLLDFKYKRHFKAEDGGRGGPNHQTGKKGKDLFIRVPLGTVVYDDLEDRLLGNWSAPANGSLSPEAAKEAVAMHGSPHRHVAHRALPSVAPKARFDISDWNSSCLQTSDSWDSPMPGRPPSSKH